MRTALVLIALAACSKSGSGPPRLDDISKRVAGECVDRPTYRTCTTPTMEVTATRASKDPDANPRVSQLSVMVTTPTGDAAVAALEPILDGLLPPAVIDGIRTRLTGPTAQAFDPNKHTTADGVLFNAGTARYGDSPSIYMVLVMYP